MRLAICRGYWASIIMFGVFALHGYRHGTSYPYITGDTFREFCDFRFDPESSFNPKAVREGNTVFVKTDLMEKFFRLMHPKISARYILVTHNSDDSCPGQFKKYLEDDKIIAWFGQNPDMEHEKLFPIPIGIANQCWKHGNVKIVESAMRRSTALTNKKKKLYLNMQVNNNIAARKVVQDLFSQKNFCVAVHAKPFQDYLSEMSRYAFVVSPHGNGLDCHRTWEALLMGCIPVVKTSTLDSLYAGLPVIIVDDWHDITEEFLLQEYDRLTASPTWNSNKLFVEYWFDQIRALQ